MNTTTNPSTLSALNESTSADPSMIAESNLNHVKKKKKRTQKRSDEPSQYSFKLAWIYGDLLTKLSLLIWGLGNIARKQIVKGVLFLSAEIGFFVFIAASGVYHLAEVPGLGTGEETRVKVDGFWVYETAKPSVEILLNGVATVFLIFAALWFAQTAMRSAFKAQQQIVRSGKAHTIWEDLHELTDSNSAWLFMSLPTLGILIFTVLPLVFMISMAFTSYDSEHSKKFDWVGLDNFAVVFGNGGNVNAQLFFSVLTWTIVWAFLPHS
ncbi:hypothetical protein [Arcanobacterium hippocoleae]|uniref:hypothetical protein n=1 Tax=Arcanobacterium hippocoleae TaxID=149017 RepID=UPI00333E7D1D